MRVYQARRGNKDALPHNVYMQVFYIIRDIPRLRSAFLQEKEQARKKNAQSVLELIDEACAEAKNEFGSKVYDGFSALKSYESYDYFNYMFRRVSGEDEGPSKRTWSNYKSRLAKKIAEKMKIF